MMAKARRKEAWSHTSHMLALIANCHRDPKKKALVPSDFNPHEDKAPRVKRKRGTVDVLKVFLPKNKRQENV